MEDYRAAWHCVRPPELDEIELIAAADEEASPEVYDHLALCPACSARVQAIAELQGRLHERLYRLFCPSSDELAAYTQGVMVAQESARVERHITGCPQCQRELALLNELAAEPLALHPQPPQRRVVAQLQPQAPSNRESTVYRAGALQITLNVEQQRGSRALRLRGAVRGSERGATASLICNGRVVSAAQVNEHGGFVLDEFAPGNCFLSLRLPNYEVVVEALRF